MLTISKRLLAFCLFGCLMLPALAAGRASEKVRKEPPTNAAGFYEYQDVVQVEGATAGELRSRARAWAARVYRSMQDVEQLDDPEAGRVILKGGFSVTWMLKDVSVRHMLSIEFKDGRYRYNLTDFSVHTFSMGHPWEAALEDRKRVVVRKGLLEKVSRESETMLASLAYAMSGKGEAAEEEW